MNPVLVSIKETNGEKWSNFNQISHRPVEGICFQTHNLIIYSCITDTKRCTDFTFIKKNETKRFIEKWHLTVSTARLCSVKCSHRSTRSRITGSQQSGTCLLKCRFSELQMPAFLRNNPSESTF